MPTCYRSFAIVACLPLVIAGGCGPDNPENTNRFELVIGTESEESDSRGIEHVFTLRDRLGNQGVFSLFRYRDGDPIEIAFREGGVSFPPDDAHVVERAQIPSELFDLPADDKNSNVVDMWDGILEPNVKHNLWTAHRGRSLIYVGYDTESRKIFFRDWVDVPLTFQVELEKAGLLKEK